MDSTQVFKLVLNKAKENTQKDGSMDRMKKVGTVLFLDPKDDKPSFYKTI